VEPGETSRQAIIREMAEELGILVEPVHRLGAIRVPDSRHVLAVWRLVQIAGELCANPDEIAEFRWTPIENVASIPRGLPSNVVVLNMLGYGPIGSDSLSWPVPRKKR
jgi:8-oxo-dGTP pyrophosphatase MutT (NUDIX family)